MKRLFLPLPPELSYLKKPATRHAVRIDKDEYSAYIRQLSDSSLRELARVSNLIQKQNHQLAISKWMHDCHDPEFVGYSIPLFYLLRLLEHMGEHGIRPFYLGMPYLIQIKDELDWSRFPLKLKYLIKYAEKYGKYQYSSQVLDFVEKATDKQVKELKSLVEKINRQNDWPLIEMWLGRNKITESREAAYVYFLLGLMDAFHLFEPNYFHQNVRCAKPQIEYIPEQKEDLLEEDKTYYCPDGLPDAIDDLNGLVAFICNDKNDFKRREDAAHHLFYRAAETEEEGIELLDRHLLCVLKCEPNEFFMDSWRKALRIIMHWNFGDKRELIKEKEYLYLDNPVKIKALAQKIRNELFSKKIID